MFLSECKAILKSKIYFAFLAVVVLFYVSQFENQAGQDIKQYEALTAPAGNKAGNGAGGGQSQSSGANTGWSPKNPLLAPLPGQESYGSREAEIPEQVMPAALWRLSSEWAANGFTSYATGFYRKIKLSEAQLAEIEALLVQMTGLSVAEFDSYPILPVTVGYEEFKENMAYIDRMIGGASYYDIADLKQYGQEAVTYEEKLAEYHDFLNQDKITGAYARYFCDYMGITVALFAVFLPVSFLLRDRRAKMNELIYSRQKSAAAIVLTRYFAVVGMTLLPVFLLSLIPTFQLLRFGLGHGMAADGLAFIKYIIAWLMPTALTVTAVAFLITIFSDGPIAILLQVAWSWYWLMAGIDTLEGGHYGFDLAIRHNVVGNLALMQENMGALIANRVGFTAFSAVLVLLSVYLYHLKRQGRLDVLRRLRGAKERKSLDGPEDK